MNTSIMRKFSSKDRKSSFKVAIIGMKSVGKSGELKMNLLTNYSYICKALYIICIVKPTSECGIDRGRGEIGRASCRESG